MTREKLIRSNLQKIQAKYHTPTSKIATDIKFHQSLLSRFINDKMTEAASERFLKAMENWLSDRL